MCTSAELEELRKEVASLQQQVAQLQPTRESVHCSYLVVRDPKAPQGARAELIAGENGPVFKFFNGQKTCCFTIALEDDRPQIHLNTSKASPAVKIEVEQEERGRVIILEKGRARAAMHTIAKGGVVAALHDDGHARAALVATEYEGGEVLVLTPDNTTGVRLTGALPCGGMVQVCQTNGKPGVVLFGGEECGIITIENKQGKTVAMFPTGESG